MLGLNVQSTGQGHATTFIPMVAQRLGIKPEQVVHRQGDSAMEIAGYASVGSRSAMTVSHALVKTTDALIAKGKTIAALVLETAEADIEYSAGRFGVVGTDRNIGLFELAGRAKEMKKRGEIADDLDTKVNAETPLTFPNGCHIAEVEIDPLTGALTLVGYAAVDDCGNALNPMIVEGQTHGSIAQGLGPAMMESAVFDGSGGQLVTGSFMDYAIPRADDLPAFKDDMHLVPAKTNPLGVKGAGEAGTTAAIAAVMNAVADAVPCGAAAHLDMPATAEKIWQACRRGRRRPHPERALGARRSRRSRPARTASAAALRCVSKERSTARGGSCFETQRSARRCVAPQHEGEGSSRTSVDHPGRPPAVAGGRLEG